MGEVLYRDPEPSPEPVHTRWDPPTHTEPVHNELRRPKIIKHSKQDEPHSDKPANYYSVLRETDKNKSITVNNMRSVGEPLVVKQHSEIRTINGTCMVNQPTTIENVSETIIINQPNEMETVSEVVMVSNEIETVGEILEVNQPVLEFKMY